MTTTMPDSHQLTLLCVVILLLSQPVSGRAEWSSYGGDKGASRYSTLTQINRNNVTQLIEAWHYRTGDLQNKSRAIGKSAFEGTPILIQNQLILCTPFNEIISLDPDTGRERWRFDAQIGLDQDPANQYVCRGVSYWLDTLAAESESCRGRIFMGTNDGRLIAVDSLTGNRCSDFGDDGRRLEPGSPEIGRLAVKGFVPIGYYKDPEKSAKTFLQLDGDRYSIPGDYASIAADGSITLLGRGSVCINTGGEKVFPEEVEEVLKLHESVLDAVCVGIPDDRFARLSACRTSTDVFGVAGVERKPRPRSKSIRHTAT